MKIRDSFSAKKSNYNLVSIYRNELYGISILWIMLFHGYLCEVSYFQNLPIINYVGRFIQYGNMGCEVFIILSGICLYFSFHNKPDIRSFFKKRILRVFPSILLICGPYWGWMLIHQEISLSDFVTRLFTIRFWAVGDQQIWFISFILLCYFLYPYIYYCIFSGSGKTKISAICLTILAIVLTFAIRQEYPAIYENIEIAITRFPAFILGCFLGKYVYEKKEFSTLWWFVWIAGFIFCFSILELDILHNIYRRYFYLVGGISITFLFAGLVNWLPEFLKACFPFLGNHSLELYLIHIILIRLYKKNFLLHYAPGSAGKYLLLLCIAICIAWGIQMLRHFIAWGFHKIRR